MDRKTSIPKHRVPKPKHWGGQSDEIDRSEPQQYTHVRTRALLDCALQERRGRQHRS